MKSFQYKEKVFELLHETKQQINNKDEKDTDNALHNLQTRIENLTYGGEGGEATKLYIFPVNKRKETERGTHVTATATQGDSTTVNQYLKIYHTAWHDK